MTDARPPGPRTVRSLSLTASHIDPWLAFATDRLKVAVVDPGLSRTSVADWRAYLSRKTRRRTGEDLLATGATLVAMSMLGDLTSMFTLFGDIVAFGRVLGLGEPGAILTYIGNSLYSHGDQLRLLASRRTLAVLRVRLALQPEPRAEFPRLRLRGLRIKARF